MHGIFLMNTITHKHRNGLDKQSTKTSLYLKSLQSCEFIKTTYSQLVLNILYSFCRVKIQKHWICINVCYLCLRLSCHHGLLSNQTNIENPGGVCCPWLFFVLSDILKTWHLVQTFFGIQSWRDKAQIREKSKLDGNF